MREKIPKGRPSKYKPEYCQMLIDHMSKGFSFESFAGIVDVNRDTLFEWATAHDEFNEAKHLAFARNLIFWENVGIEGLYNQTDVDESGKTKSVKSLNATVWIFNMKNRHKWRDRQPDESDIVVNNVMGLSDSDLDSKIEDKIKKQK